MSKELLADALRRYPSWGDAYIAELQRADRLAAVVKAAWGTLLAYYTDIPEAEVRRLIAACESVNDLLDSPADRQEDNYVCNDCGASVAYEGGLPDDCLRCGSSRLADRADSQPEETT